jgi:dTDP-glucose 4,6-dehydratase
MSRSFSTKGRVVPKRILVTGGAGFIGSALVRYLVTATAHHVTVLDKLTYAGGRAFVEGIASGERFRFFQLDIADPVVVRDVIEDTRPDVIVHLAAETHVDRSIDQAAVFVRTNVVGTQVMLDAHRSVPLEDPNTGFKKRAIAGT